MARPIPQPRALVLDVFWGVDQHLHLTLKSENHCAESVRSKPGGPAYVRNLPFLGLCKDCTKSHPHTLRWVWVCGDEVVVVGGGGGAGKCTPFYSPSSKGLNAGCTGMGPLPHPPTCAALSAAPSIRSTLLQLWRINLKTGLRWRLRRSWNVHCVVCPGLSYRFSPAGLRPPLRVRGSVCRHQLMQSATVPPSHTNSAFPHSLWTHDDIEGQKLPTAEGDGTTILNQANLGKVGGNG